MVRLSSISVRLASRFTYLGITASCSLLLLSAIGCTGSDSETTEPLLCYVGGTMRPAMEELAATYEKETGKKIQIDFGDSGSNYVKIKTTRKGDLNVCHDPFQGALRQENLSARGWTVAYLTPSIAVPKGNPKGITGLESLAEEGMRVGLTDEEYSTLGHICPVMFRRAGIAERIEKNVVTRMRMGGQLANNVFQGHLDAAIVWNAVIFARKENLDLVPIAPAHLPDPELDAVTTATYGRIDMSRVRVAVDVLACSTNQEEALKFAQFVVSPRGRAVFEARGFTPAPEETEEARTASETGADEAQVATAGDEAESLYVYCGAGLRPAVEEIFDAFLRQTGVKVQTDYAGSGVLLSRIELSRRGDVYLPGEMEYIGQLADKGLVASRYAVAWLVPTILVKKGNPLGIRSLRDLVKPGLKLGLGNPEACQIGRTSEALFRKNSVDLDAVRERTTFSSLTVNELGVQVDVGQVDAAVVWEPIARLHSDGGESVPIPAEENVISRVGVAVLTVSQNKKRAEELAGFLQAEAARAIFAKHHYAVTPPGSAIEEPTRSGGSA